jgi:hypothetical protein
MTDPYRSLGESLLRAAHRQEPGSAAPGPLRAWLARHFRAATAATLLVLSGGAVALAATGVLSGVPVSPEQAPSASSGNGLPLGRVGPAPLISTADPAGGLGWGARVFHTTRGQVCIQVGRVQADQIGELGEDSAFGNDGRFHALPPDALPPGYGGSSAEVECVAAGRTVMVENANADRSGARLIPEEFELPGRRRVPPVSHRRALAYGLLGPHAVSVTYRTPAGLRTMPVRGRDGAFLIVQNPGYFKSSSLVGASVGGLAEPGSVRVLPPSPLDGSAMISAATFRFGRTACSDGLGAPVRRQCGQRGVFTPLRWYSPHRGLNQPVKLTLLPQSPAACKRAFLPTPCYRGKVTFIAPYAITRAGADYSINGAARCPVGGRPETSWGLERNVRRHELIRTLSLGLFVYTPKCAEHESFTIVYLNTGGPSPSAPHESVIVGRVSFAEAILSNGASGLTKSR